jgi:serine protease inhibitor
MLIFTKPMCSIPNNSDKSRVAEQFVSSINNFGLALLSKLASTEVGKNVVISPTSVFYALAMVNNGAEGNTKNIIQSTLHLQQYTRNEINTYVTELTKSLMTASNIEELTIANSLWLNKQYNLKIDFKNECEHSFSAKTFVRDFDSRDISKEINEWIFHATKGNITNILDELSSNNLLVLLNAIYFESKWAHQFDSIYTKDEPFYLLDGTIKSYPRMSQMEDFYYYENSEYQVVTLNYDTHISLCVFLPREKNGLPKLLEEVKQITSNDGMSLLQYRNGIVELPRFKTEYSVELNEALKSLGMDIAFEKGADFSRMADTSVFISKIIHKNYLEVNERGTKAAAVTSIRQTIMSQSEFPENPPEPFRMIVDHPFLCVIKDNITGLVLFVGSIANPEP